MATTQTSRSNDKNKNAAKNKNAQPAQSRNVESETGERDENYNLISVLYHALQGAETISQYQRDAQRSGDEQLMQFFEEARTGYTEIAQEAKQLLADRLETDESEMDDDESDDEDEED